nr:hypothetical protein [Tanacetum cinerariifolium]
PPASRHHHLRPAATTISGLLSPPEKFSGELFRRTQKYFPSPDLSNPPPTDAMHRQHHRDLRLHPRRRPAATTPGGFPSPDLSNPPPTDAMHRQHHRDLRLHPRRRPAATTSSHNTPLSTTTATVTISNSRHPYTVIIISPLPPLSPHHSRQPPTCNTTTIFVAAPLSPSTPHPRRHHIGHQRHNHLPTTLTLFTPQPPPPSPHHCCPHHHDPPAPPPAFAAVDALTPSQPPTETPTPLWMVTFVLLLV